MKRLIAFLLAICACVGLIAGSAAALTARSGDLEFTEVVRFGDPAALDGRTIRSGIVCGDHMTWQTVYSFDGENAYDTRFLFTQQVEREEQYVQRAYMEAYTTNGMGGSTTGGFKLRNTGYGDAVRAVAAVTGAGETREMNLKLADYVQYHALNLDLHYITDKYYCAEGVDLWDYITTRWDDDISDFDQWIAVEASACYQKFSQLFRFPVGEEEIVEVSATRDDAGILSSVGYNNLNGPEISVICALNDLGAYCIPVFQKDGQPLKGEYRDGMGIYFIPWKELAGQYQYVNRGYTREQVQVITLDVDRAENILPMEESSVVYGMEVSEDGSVGRMISLEEGVYVLTEIDFVNRQIKSRLELLEVTGDFDYVYWPTWMIRGDLMILEACEQLALIHLGDTPALEFAVSMEQVKDGFWDAMDDYSGLHYDGEKLIIAACRGFYDQRSLVVMVFDRTGPLYWGEYECSVFSCNDPGYSPYIHSWEKPLVIQ